jgi:hypothetical protein
MALSPVKQVEIGLGMYSEYLNCFIRNPYKAQPHA